MRPGSLSPKAIGQALSGRPHLAIAGSGAWPGLVVFGDLTAPPMTSRSSCRRGFLLGRARFIGARLKIAPRLARH
jgi:hypothetical protein